MWVWACLRSRLESHPNSKKILFDNYTTDSKINTHQTAQGNRTKHRSNRYKTKRALAKIPRKTRRFSTATDFSGNDASLRTGKTGTGIEGGVKFSFASKAEERMGGDRKWNRIEGMAKLYCALGGSISRRRPLSLRPAAGAPEAKTNPALVGGPLHVIRGAVDHHKTLRSYDPGTKDRRICGGLRVWKSGRL